MEDPTEIPLKSNNFFRNIFNKVCIIANGTYNFI